MPMPILPNTTALELTSIANNIKTQILTGVDIDLSSLLSLLPPPISNRQIDYSDFSVTLKNSAHNPSHIGSLSSFFIAFSHYSKITCVFFFLFPTGGRSWMIILQQLQRSCYLTEELAFTHTTSCFQQNASFVLPYWGALDTDVHNRVFLGCRNISCGVCRSVAQIHHSLSSDLPFNSPLPRFIPGKIK